MSISYSLGQPAVEFEQAHKLSGIAGIYKFPDAPGLDRLSLQNKIWSQLGEEMLPPSELKRIWSQLQQLNPELAVKIDFNHNITEQLRDVVHGIVSGINTDDINLYIKRMHHGMPLWSIQNKPEEIARKAVEGKIMQRLDNTRPIGRWLASEPTLDKIWHQVHERPIINSLEKAGATVKNNQLGWMLGGALVAAAGILTAQALIKRNPEDAMKAVKGKGATDAGGDGHAVTYLKEKQDTAGPREK